MQDILWLSVLAGYLCCALPGSRGSLIPTEPTVDSCMFRNITMTDRNWQAALYYFRACRTLGLEMGDKMPPRYMSRLAKKLKYSNADFLDATKFGRMKMREVEREFNDLYKEVSLLAANVNMLNSENKKKENVTAGTSGTRDDVGGDELPETSSQVLLEEPRREDPPERESRGARKTRVNDDDPINRMTTQVDDDYGPVDLLEPVSLFILVISIVILVVSICTCRYVRRIHKYVELAPKG